VKQDPLALAFFAAALAVLAGLVLYVAFFLKTPEPAPPSRAFDFLRQALREKLTAKPAPQQEPQPPTAKAAAAPAAKSTAKFVGAAAQAGTGAAYPVFPLPPGTRWTYRVSLEPQLWQDAALVYRSAQQGGALAIDTDFTHAKGRMTFRLGRFQAGDPAHANTRFPGFFLYPAYFGSGLRIGQTVAAEWPWQLPGGAVKAGRVKRFEGTVMQAEQYSGPVFDMASMLRIEGRLYYLEDGMVQAVARETLWYAGKAAQLVRIEREGRTPDEGAARIVAELTAME
jgi:hypothetical protein